MKPESATSANSFAYDQSNSQLKTKISMDIREGQSFTSKINHSETPNCLSKKLSPNMQNTNSDLDHDLNNGVDNSMND